MSWATREPYAAEPVVDAPLPPEEAARTMVVPDGFHVSLFAGEPDVQQPIGFCIDDRGRLWVAEAYNYPQHGTKPGDRIVILEDADGDGRFDRRTIFYDKLNYVSGIEVGFGGAWVMSPPYFYFIPDRNGDDVPDSPPQVLLDGFGNHANAHNMANGFAWGPDGWLYGTHGRTNWSMLGKPGTPEQQRVRFDGGVYRYHPVRHVWEPYADGTTNPWGIDWDDFGQAFMCNCVDPHLFHVIQGAHYDPWRNRESSRYAYQRIESIADHLHFVGKRNVRDGLGSTEEDTAGGGHAHCGTMVYLGDNWPDRYRNTVFMNNIHGHRINNDILRRAGSGYTASHGPDLMRSRDLWYMGVTLLYGPDGSVFASDWSDTGECHSTKNTRRETGRIYKISFGQPQWQPVDMAKLSDAELVQLQLHRNDWHVRHARRLLQERAAAGRDMTHVYRLLQEMFSEQQDVPRKLRALWALRVTGGLDDEFLAEQLDHASEHLRAWTIQLLCEDGKPSRAILKQLLRVAKSDDSALVRLHLACALQRLAAENRWAIADALAQRVEDASDQNLPLMMWYGIEPLVHDDLNRFVKLCGTARIPTVRRHIARRVAEFPAADAGLNSLVQLLTEANDVLIRVDVLGGLLEGFQGRRSVPMPPSWPAAYAALRPLNVFGEQALQLALIFDDPTALAELRKQAIEDELAAARQRAIHALVAKRPKDLAPLLIEFVADPAVQTAALRGLAEYDHPGTVERILSLYSTFNPAARQDALQTLASRPEWAMSLLDAVEAQRIPRSDLTAFTARQLQNLGHEPLAARVQALWGDLRATPADKARQIAGLKRRLTPEALKQADRSVGRAVFQKTCANCHKLFDAGGAIGPEITGAQRMNLDYLLENLIDPSAAVSRDFQMQIIQTTAGRVITGLAVAENDSAVTIQTVNEKIVVPRAEIDQRATSPVSLMPDRMLDKLAFEEVRDLIAYLSSPGQVPLPEGVPTSQD
jgi:putative membrane-bound dehydrogenase-like protein